MLLDLIPHAATRPERVLGVTATLSRRADGGMFLSFCVMGVSSLSIHPAKPGRDDGLWQHTCFELFAKSADESEYLEFNFAPHGAWAAYSFEDRRTGQRDLPCEAPVIVDWPPVSGMQQYASRYGLDVILDRSVLPPGKTVFGLSAVIEESDGTKSYWALRHPPGKPDFHHPDCFALELAAAEQP